MPSVLFDGVVVPDGAAKALGSLGQAAEFLQNQYRHCKPILLLGDAQAVGEAAGVLAEDDDWALTRDVESFIAALGRHRNWDRATDPPRV
jgi:catalase